MKKSTAWREDRVEMFGTWVSKTGARVYELLSQGKTMREVSDLTGVAMGVDVWIHGASEEIRGHRRKKENGCNRNRRRRQ